MHRGIDHECESGRWLGSTTCNHCLRDLTLGFCFNLVFLCILTHRLSSSGWNLASQSGTLASPSSRFVSSSLIDHYGHLCIFPS